MTTASTPRRADLRRHRRRRRPQRPRQRGLPREVRPADADPGAAPLRRRRRHHRGTAARLLVHHLLLRALAAPPADHPGSRAHQARLHAAADVVHVRPDGGRRLPVADQGPRPQPPGDRPPQPHDADAYEQYSHDLDMVCQALKPLLDQAPPDLFSDDPEELARARRRWAAAPRPGQAHPAQRRPAADRQRRGLPGRLLRVRARQGLPGELEHHRHEGRAALAGLRPRAALPLAGRARRRVSAPGRSTRAATAASPRCSPARPSRSAPRSASRRRSTAVITKDGRATGVALTDGTEFSRRHRRERPRPAPHLPRARRAARAARRPGREHPAARFQGTRPR